MKYIDKVRNSLSPEELEEIEKEYRSRNMTTKELIKKYNLNIPARSLVDLFSPKKTQYSCPYCGTPLVRRISRSSVSKPFCLTCSHINIPSCMCSNCQAIKVQKLRELQDTQRIARIVKEKKINQTWLRPSDPVSLSDICRRHRIMLNILLCSRLSSKKCESELFYFDFSVDHSRICPDQCSLEEIIQELLQYGILKIDSELSNAAFNAYNEKDNSLSSLFCMNYRLNIVPSDVTALENYISEKIWLSYDEFVEWWRWISLAELRSYCEYCCNNEKIEIEIGTITTNVFIDMLQSCSLALAKHIIRLACQSAKLKATEQSPLVAKRSFPKMCHELTQRFIDGSWTYDNSKYSPQLYSSAAKYVYSTLLHVGGEAQLHSLAEAAEMYQVYKESVSYD